jgi:hypothetical protein
MKKEKGRGSENVIFSLKSKPGNFFVLGSKTGNYGYENFVFFAQNIQTEIKLIESKLCKIMPFFDHFHLRQKICIEKKRKNIYIFSPLEVKHMRNIRNGFQFAWKRKHYEAKPALPNLDPELSFIWPRMFLFHKFLLNRQTKSNQ